MGCYGRFRAPSISEFGVLFNGFFSVEGITVRHCCSSIWTLHRVLSVGRLKSVDERHLLVSNTNHFLPYPKDPGKS
jgi:hypothetical protein